MTENTAKSTNIWANHTKPVDRAQAEIDAILARVDLSKYETTDTPSAVNPQISLEGPMSDLAPTFPTETNKTYGQAYKYVNGQQVPVITESSKARLRDKKMCWVEFAFGFIRYTVFDLIVHPLRRLSDSFEVVHTETPVAEAAPSVVARIHREPSVVPTPQIAHEAPVITSEDRVEQLDLLKIAHFGFAAWIGLTIALATLSQFELIAL